LPAPMSAPLCPSHAASVAPALPSFPTRRSSDLGRVVSDREQRRHAGRARGVGTTGDGAAGGAGGAGQAPRQVHGGVPHARRSQRSEEHTSELQSPYDLVCRLLLEKKKTNEWSVS